MKYLSNLLTLLSGEEMEAKAAEFLVASLVITAALIILSINI